MLLLLGLLLTCSGASDQRGTAAGSPDSASAPAGYTVVGKQILDSSGRVFIPDGIQFGAINFAVSDWRTNESTEFTQAAMQAAHDFWHSNTTRMQLASANLFATTPYDAEYLTLIDQVVGWANQLGMNIILSLQYEGTTHQLMPTQDSVTFWTFVAAHFKDNPRVFFDVFNEPSPGALLGVGNTDAAWSFWQQGGTSGGMTYVGMQSLVDAIRATGAENLIFVEGNCYGGCLDKLPAYALSGTNIVYATHPYFGSGRTTPAAWDTYFGSASEVLPVVADEWGEFQSSHGECVPDAPTLVPQFLAYLNAHDIGLIGFSLWPGTLIRGWSFTTPTAFDSPPYSCTSTPWPNADPSAQGAGQLVSDYFAQSSQP